MNISEIANFLSQHSCFNRNEITATLEVQLSNTSVLLVPVFTPENQLNETHEHLKKLVQENETPLLIG